MWGATPLTIFVIPHLVFQSTLPVWGATSCPKRISRRYVISIHAPRVGSDLNLHVLIYNFSRFQSTLPVWGATELYSAGPRCARISIHAPRVGSDLVPPWWAFRRRCISIHAPRVGSDQEPGRRHKGRSDFNPRSPCGERQHNYSILSCPTNFNPRSPCGERQARGWSPGYRKDISIHAPRVGSDISARSSSSRRTRISIHAPRVGSDFAPDSFFSPPSIFQSTLPVWGATHRRREGCCRGTISIHAPRVGSDLFVCRLSGNRREISIHAPRVGSDISACSSADNRGYFNPRSPCGERRYAG